MPITPGCQPSLPRTNTGRDSRLFLADHGLGLFQDLFFQGLALPVEIVQISGLHPGLGQVVAEEQFQGAPGLAHPAGGIEPGRQPEDHVLVGDGFAFQLGDFLQGDDAGAAALLQDLEPLVHQDAVFPHQGHHVGGGAQGHQVQVGPAGWAPGAALNQPSALSSARTPRARSRATPTPASSPKGISVATALGVDHGQGLGQLRGNFVVVGDDHLQPLFLAQATSSRR